MGAQRFEEAAAAFRDIALQRAGYDAGADASDLYLEAVHALVRRGGATRGVCLDKMAEDLPEIESRYCSARGAAANDTLCSRLGAIRCDVQRAKAQELVTQADQGVPASRRLDEQAAEMYMDLWNKTQGAEAGQGKPARCERIDEVVYNACRAFQAARLIGKAIQCRQMFVDPARPGGLRSRGPATADSAAGRTGSPSPTLARRPTTGTGSTLPRPTRVQGRLNCAHTRKAAARRS